MAKVKSFKYLGMGFIAEPNRVHTKIVVIQIAQKTAAAIQSLHFTRITEHIPPALQLYSAKGSSTTRQTFINY